MLIDCGDRINICRFRCTNIKAPVVTLGYTHMNIPYANRICTICNLNEVRDELHYITQCPALQLHRRRYISNYYIINSKRAIYQLFQSENVNVLKKLANFISEINRQLR